MMPITKKVFVCLMMPALRFHSEGIIISLLRFSDIIVLCLYISTSRS